MDKFINFYDRQDVQKFDWGEVAWIHEPSNSLTERLSAGFVKFFPGMSQSSHVHFGEEQILYIISGKGINVINGEKQSVSEGALIHCPPYCEHEVINNGQEDLIFLITYTPSKQTESYHHLSLTSNDKITDILEIEILEDIQRQIGELFNLSIVIMDNEYNNITKPISANQFCELCKKANLCEEKNTTYGSLLIGLDKAFICCNNIIALIIPIVANNKIFGYIKCGHFILNKPTDIEQNILNKLNDDLMIRQELIDAYNDIPVLIKSRLYVLEETVGIASKLISYLVENNLLEKEFAEKNKEILKTRKENINLANELKQLNTKLLKSKVSSSLENSIFKPKHLANREKLYYPFSYENNLKDSMKKLDQESSKRIIQEIISTYEKGILSFEEVKEIFEELVVSLCRILIYEETKDSEIFLQMRGKYKDRIKSCDNYRSIQSILIEFSYEVICILRDLLLCGKYGVINKINSYIKNNFRQNITLSYIADMFFLSPNYLSALFNDENGVSLKDYINKLRVDESKKYLEQTDLKISEISKLVGFNQLSYFGTIFKKYERCTPNEYRVKIK